MSTDPPALCPEVSWPHGYGLRVLREVDSTLNEAARVAGGIAGPEWIMARRQTAARGRRGRPWQTPEGNLNATLVLRPDGPPAQSALLSFVASLALFDALQPIAGPQARFSLKWPNDVLLNGGKLAGILLESAGQGMASQYLAIGVGVNLIAAPPLNDVEPQALRPVSLLGETGQTLSADDMLRLLAAAFAHRFGQFRDFGFAPIRTAWLAQAARLGETVIARTAHEQTTGRFDTVDAEGNLVISTPHGLVRIAAADIYF